MSNSDGPGSLFQEMADEIAARDAEIARLREVATLEITLADAFRVALNNVSGALVDSGIEFRDDYSRYGEAVRKLVDQRADARNKADHSIAKGHFPPYQWAGGEELPERITTWLKRYYKYWAANNPELTGQDEEPAPKDEPVDDECGKAADRGRWCERERGHSGLHRYRQCPNCLTLQREAGSSVSRCDQHKGA